MDHLTWVDVMEIATSAGAPANDRSHYEGILEHLRQKNKCLPKCSERYEYILDRAEKSVGEKLSSQRTAGNTLIRSIVAYQMRKEGYTITDIGKQMNRDHSTVTHLVRKFNDMLSVPAAYESEIEMFRDFEKSIVNPGHVNP